MHSKRTQPPTVVDFEETKRNVLDIANGSLSIGNEDEENEEEAKSDHMVQREDDICASKVTIQHSDSDEEEMKTINNADEEVGNDYEESKKETIQKA